jgi:hypothetical protein
MFQASGEVPSFWLVARLDCHLYSHSQIAIADETKQTLWARPPAPLGFTCRKLTYDPYQAYKLKNSMRFVPLSIQLLYNFDLLTHDFYGLFLINSTR